MAIIIQRTNPERAKSGFGGEQWRCCACRQIHDSEADARTCAETDHATGRHKAAGAPRYQIGAAA